MQRLCLVLLVLPGGKKKNPYLNKGGRTEPLNLSAGMPCTARNKVNRKHSINKKDIISSYREHERYLK